MLASCLPTTIKDSHGAPLSLSWLLDWRPVPVVHKRSAEFVPVVVMRKVANKTIDLAEFALCNALQLTWDVFPKQGL